MSEVKMLAIHIDYPGDPSVGIQGAFWDIPDAISSEEDAVSREEVRALFSAAFEAITGGGHRVYFSDEDVRPGAEPDPSAPVYAAFWAYWRNRYVGIVLTKEKPVWEDSFGEPTDEGFHSEYVRYSLCTDGDAGPYVLCEEGTWSRDCDGPHETSNDYVCPLADLEAGGFLMIGNDEDDPNICFYSQVHRMPKWQDRGGWQRDVYAERAGY